GRLHRGHRGHHLRDPHGADRGERHRPVAGLGPPGRARLRVGGARADASHGRDRPALLRRADPQGRVRPRRDGAGGWRRHAVRRSAVAVALLSSVLAVSAVRPATAQTTVDVDGYLARLDQAQTVLRDPSVDPAEALGAARAALSLPVQVTWPDGSSVVVTDGALLGTADDGDDAAAVSATQARLPARAGAASAGKAAAPPHHPR